MIPSCMATTPHSAAINHSEDLGGLQAKSGALSTEVGTACDEDVELEAYLEDRCKLTIFEDAEDEVRYLRRRCDVLFRGILTARSQIQDLHRAGFALQEAYDALGVELQEAIGDVAYWQELAAARADELRELRAEVPMTRAPGGSAATTSSQDLKSTVERVAADPAYAAIGEAGTSTPPAARARTAQGPSTHASNAALSPPPSWQQPIPNSPLQTSPHCNARGEPQVRPMHCEEACIGSTSRPVPSLQEFQPAQEALLQASRAEADRWRVLAELRAQENDALRQAGALHSVGISPTSPTRGRMRATSPSASPGGRSASQHALQAIEETLRGGHIVGVGTQAMSRSCSPPRPSPACSGHVGSPLSHARTPPRPATSSPATWKHGSSAGGSGSAVAGYGLDSPHADAGFAVAAGTRRSLFSHAESVCPSLFGPGSVPRSCPGLGCPTRRAAGGKENSKAHDNVFIREDLKARPRQGWTPDGAGPGISPQPFPSVPLKSYHSNRNGGQSRHAVAPLASMASSRPQSFSIRASVVACNASPATHMVAPASGCMQPKQHTHATSGSSSAQSGTRSAGGSLAHVLGAPQVYNAMLTPPRPTNRTAEEVLPMAPLLASPSTAVAQRRLYAEAETTPDKAHRLAQLLDLPGGISALPNAVDLAEGKTLDVWLRYASR